jgi:anti-anti-sigma factor
LKATFARLGTGSRSKFVARPFLDHYAPRLTPHRTPHEVVGSRESAAKIEHPAFDYDVERRGTTTSVSLRGELDLASAKAALDALVSALRDGDLVIDASQPAFIDARGIQSILEAYRKAHQGVGAGRRVTIRAPSSQVRRVLELTGLDNLIEEQTQA